MQNIISSETRVYTIKLEEMQKKHHGINFLWCFIHGDPYGIGKQRSGSVEPSPETVHRTVSFHRSIPVRLSGMKKARSSRNELHFMVKQNLLHPNFLHGWQA